MLGMNSTAYGDVLAANVRATRSRKRLGQADVTARMRALGFDQWHRQTLGKIERGERRLTAEELLGLSGALDTSVATLMMPPPDMDFITLPSGAAVQAKSVTRSVLLQQNDGWVRWEGNTPRWFGEKHEPTQEDIATQAAASLRAQGVSEPGASRMAAMAAENEQLRRQLREREAADHGT